MKTLKAFLLSVIFVSAFTLSAFAQSQAYTPQQKIGDPKALFNKHASLVKLHLKDGTAMDVNLVYNDDINLYYKIQDVPAVVFRPISEISKIEYPDGSIEWIYEDTFGRTITEDSTDS